jgi:N-acetylneuraminate synthase
MSSWEELDAAVAVLRTGGPLTVLQCTSEYPCTYEHVGLNVMLEMRRRYDLPVGLSDHTLTNYASFAAVALGATTVERHVAFSRQMYGSDAAHSLEPPELADLVTGIRAIETMLQGDVDKSDVQPFREMKAIFEKSLVAAVDIDAGATITAEMVAAKRPGTGIPPARLGDVVGRRAAVAIRADTLLEPGQLED